MRTPSPSTDRAAVVALGGNAILQPGQVGTFEEQLLNIDGATRRIAALATRGWRVVLTHESGPQVGNRSRPPGRGRTRRAERRT